MKQSPGTCNLQPTATANDEDILSITWIVSQGRICPLGALSWYKSHEEISRPVYLSLELLNLGVGICVAFQPHALPNPRTRSDLPQILHNPLHCFPRESGADQLYQLKSCFSSHHTLSARPSNG